jgi:large subunit ribosomal protein L21
MPRFSRFESPDEDSSGGANGKTQLPKSRCCAALRHVQSPGVEHEEKMFAVIKTGGKQYSVTADDTITVMTLAGKPGDKVTFSEVLMLAGDGEPRFGAPFVGGATVTGEIVEHARGPKVLSFKKRRRQNSKRKRGHRQDLTVVKITGVSA